MSPPEVVPLDTRGADNKAAFLAAAGASLQFPAYSAGNWDAFEESLRDFVDGRRPVLVVWTGASDLPAADRDTVLQIMDTTFTDGADLLIVDDVSAAPQPDFALDRVVLSIPTGGAAAAATFWTQVVGLTPEDPLTFAADGLLLSVAEDAEFQAAPASGPVILARDVDDLQSRLRAADRPVVPVEGAAHRAFDTCDPFGNRIRFAAF